MGSGGDGGMGPKSSSDQHVSDAVSSAQSNGEHSVAAARSKEAMGVKVQDQAVAKVRPRPPSASPEQAANWFSKLSFWWMDKIMKVGWKKPLEQEDLPPLPDFDNAKLVSQHFAGVWENEQTKETPSLSMALLRAFWLRLVVAGVLQFVSIALQLTPSVFLNAVLLYIQGSPTHNFMLEVFGKHYGYYAAGAMLVVPIVQSIVDNQQQHSMFRMGIHVKTALVEVVYHKSLKLSNSARQAKSVGEIVTLMQVDTDKVMQTMPYLHSLWSAPLQVLGNLALLYYYIGWPCLMGFVLLIFTIPTQSQLVAKLMEMQRRIMLNTSRRVKLLNEVLQGMRVVKAYAWEEPFKEAVTEIRALELLAMKRRVYIRAVQSTLMLCTPFLIMLVTFAFYSGVQHKNMGAAVVFTAVSLFNAMRFPLMMYPFVLNAVLSGHVSIVRLTKLLSGEELTPGDRFEDDNSSAIVVQTENASFQWGTVLDPEDAAPDAGKAVPPGQGPPGGSGPMKGSHGKTREATRKRKWHRWGKKSKDTKGDAKVGGEGKEQAEEEKDSIPFKLSEVSLSIEHGQLVAFVGAVGSGKSSLVGALLGEMQQTAGKPVCIRGSVAYCCQQAWIMNASLRENVLFGHEFNLDRYEEVLHACALEQDLLALPDGDETEIGERGINLSGGQKQRVALARAAYFDADIYVLDDPLSAVDAHVGAHLFRNCINGLLKKKTRLFVTNQVQYVPAADFVVAIAAGRIAEMGTYQEVMSKQGEFARLMKESGSHVEAPVEDTSIEIPDVLEVIPNAPIAVSESRTAILPTTSKAVLRKEGATVQGKYSRQGALVEKEQRARGMLSFDVYRKYWTEASTVVPIGVLLLYGVVQALDAFQRYWLAYWSKDQFNETPGFYLGMYAALAAAFTGLVYLRTLGQALLGLWISRLLHEGMLKSILRAPMAFFDVTPVGRVLNRFSADQSNVDETLPFSWSMFLNIAFTVVGTLIVICIVTPIFAAVMVPVAILYFYIQQVYRRTARELKRLDAVSKSPVYQQFTETLNGLPTIRAYNQQERFLRMCDSKLDANNRAFFLLRCCDRWLSVRLEFMGNIMVAASAFLAVSKRGSLFAGYAGISIGYALQITGALSMLVRQMTDTENQMNGVERMLEYRNGILQEAPGIVDDKRPPDDWPSTGGIELDRVSMRYRPGLPLVLREVSLSVRGGDRVGVVGRTGSGKSSLMQLLFRLIEPSSGTIRIDNIDILTLGLHDLRSRLSIIPQDPILFSGTIRSNLDPFKSHTDDAIWTALEYAHLKKKVVSMKGKLDAEVVEYGENLSVGERQLLCLARVLLRKSRVLVMDEATSSVDFETDRLIQATIRAHLQNTTMLIIAHRINTVIDASRILVLDNGQVAEYGPPAELLADSSSKFYALVQDTGEQTCEHLHKVARGEIDFFAAYSASDKKSE